MQDLGKNYTILTLFWDKVIAGLDVAKISKNQATVMPFFGKGVAEVINRFFKNLKL